MKINIQRFTFRIRNRTRLLCNNPQSMLQDKIHQLPKEDQTELRAYRTPEGYLAMPTIALHRSITAAAEEFPTTAAQKSAPNTVLTPKNFAPIIGRMYIEPEEWVILYDLDDNPLTDYVIDGRRVVNKGTGGAVWRYRPRIDEYQASFTIILDVQPFLNDPRELLEDIIVVAGERQGWGNFRPGLAPKKRGPFGKYALIK